MEDGYARASIPSAFSGPNDRQGKLPLLFQVVSPDFERELLPEAMYMHVNPDELSMSYSKIVERFPTRGGWVEQHFGEHLSEISASNTSGAFVNVQSGLAVANRRDTIAYEKFQHLIDLFHNNGNIHDTNGVIQFRGLIRLTFEGGIYDGQFRNLSINESASTPFQLTADWSFKVQREVRSLLF